LPFFMAVRATIRAKVLGLGIEDVAGEPETARTARRYLALARALEPAPAPRLVGVGGVSGTGKTTLARALAPQLAPAPGAVLLRSDTTRKRLWGVAPDERLPEEAYTAAFSERVFAELRGRARHLLAHGTSVIVDAVHGREDERRELATAAARAGVRFDGLWLEATEETLLSRVAHRRGDASDADAAIVRRQLEQDFGAIDWTRVDAGNDTAAVAERIARALEVGGGALADLE
jgi:hypothetical protein